MMEEGKESTNSALTDRENSSVSPTILYNEGSQQEPMILADMKMLPANYSQCEFSDLVNLIGMYHSSHELPYPCFTCHNNEYANVYDSSHVNAVDGN
jgi:hypothetical protein